ncbi:hypothetical protein D3C85_906200 [compost metagenome]
MRGQHDFFVVVAIVATQLVVDDTAPVITHRGQEFGAGGLDRVLTLDHHLFGAAPGHLTLRQSPCRTQHSALLEVIKQVFFFSRIVHFKQRERALRITGFKLIGSLLQLKIVVAVGSTTAQLQRSA